MEANISNQDFLDSFLINFSSGISDEQRIKIFEEESEKIKKLDNNRPDFLERIYFESRSFARDFAIDPITLKSIVFNRCSGYDNIAVEELISEICLSEKLSSTEKDKRIEQFITGYACEVNGFKTPLFKVISNANNKMISSLIMKFKKVILIDLHGNVIQ